MCQPGQSHPDTAPPLPSPLLALVHLPINHKLGTIAPTPQGCFKVQMRSREAQARGALLTPPASGQPQDLVGDIPEGEVGEGHASVSAQGKVEWVLGHLVHLIVNLQQLCHGLQPACRDVEGAARLGTCRASQVLCLVPCTRPPAFQPLSARPPHLRALPLSHPQMCLEAQCPGHCLPVFKLYSQAHASRYSTPCMALPRDTLWT